MAKPRVYTGDAMDRFTPSLFLLLLLSSAVNQGLSGKPRFWTAVPHTHALDVIVDRTEKANVPLELSGRADAHRVTRVNCMGGSEGQQVRHPHVTAQHFDRRLTRLICLSRTPESQYTRSTYLGWAVVQSHYGTIFPASVQLFS